MGKFGTKGIFYSLPITLGVIIFVLRGVHIGVVPDAVLWFFAGVYVMIFQVHLDNLRYGDKTRKGEEEQK